MDLEERIMELSRYGYACGQILAILHTPDQRRVFLPDGVQQQNGQDLAAGVSIPAQFHDSLLKIHSFTSFRTQTGHR